MELVPGKIRLHINAAFAEYLWWALFQTHGFNLKIPQQALAPRLLLDSSVKIILW